MTDDILQDVVGGKTRPEQASVCFLSYFSSSSSTKEKLVGAVMIAFSRPLMRLGFDSSPGVKRGLGVFVRYSALRDFP